MVPVWVVRYKSGWEYLDRFQFAKPCWMSGWDYVCTAGNRHYLK